MQQLQERIRQEAVILPGDIIKVDGFLNHLIDIDLATEMAREFYRVFGNRGVSKILTVEASGIALATLSGQVFGVPVLFAKKAKSDNIEGGLFKSEIFSYTYNRDSKDEPTLFGRMKKDIPPYDAWKNELSLPQTNKQRRLCDVDLSGGRAAAADSDQS